MRHGASCEHFKPTSMEQLVYENINICHVMMVHHIAKLLEISVKEV